MGRPIMTSNAGYRHGHAARGQRSPTHNSWRGMIERCTNPKNKKYKNYGGRGVKVCGRWGDFCNFLADMGERPEGMSLERRDSNKDYEPGNCRWATQKEQMCNCSRNHVLCCYAGPKGAKSVAEWAEISGTKYRTILSRIRYGWTDKEAVFGRAA